MDDPLPSPLPVTNGAQPSALSVTDEVGTPHALVDDPILCPHELGFHGIEDELLLCAMMIFFGIIISFGLSRLLPSVPFTPTLLVLGIAIAQYDYFFLATGRIHASVQTALSIDGHTMMIFFLPPLLFADCMQLEWKLVRRCLGQCLLLAVPGVILGSVLTALFAVWVLPYGLHAELGLAFGAVLSATDPVAVVAILKDLGASPSLTMVIGGESLLNDGSAIVVWTLFFHRYMGFTDDSAVHVLTKLVVGGVALGLAFGAGVLWLMSLPTRRLDVKDVTLQVAISLVAAYSCFYVGEILLQVSGVLAVVFMGGFLAATFWPLIQSRATMEHVWHTVEWMYNSALFQLAGLIVGGQVIPAMIPFGSAAFNAYASARASNASLPEGLYFNEGKMVAVDTDEALLAPSDLLWVVVTYLVCVVVRVIVVGASYPLLRRMGYGLSLREAAIICWGGLRGAVGLALALVMRDEIAKRGEARTSMLLLLHVTGVALLTLLINAPTMAPLLEALGMTRESSTKEEARHDIERRIVEYAWRRYEQLVETSRAPRDRFWRRQIIRAVSFIANDHKAKSALAQNDLIKDKSDRGSNYAQLEKEDMADMSISRVTMLSPETGAIEHSYDENEFRTGGERVPLRAHDGGAASSETHTRRKETQDGDMQRAHASDLGLAEQSAAFVRSPESDHFERLKEIRKIATELLKQAYTEMTEDGVIPTNGNLHFLLVSAVDAASDNLHLPLYDWCALLPSLAFPPTVAAALRVLRWGRGQSGPRVTTVRRWTGSAEDDEVYSGGGGFGSFFRKCFSNAYSLRRLVEVALINHVNNAHPIRSRAYLLTCFITAHLEVQAELRWMFSADDDAMHAEAAQVAQESELAVAQAEAYLRELGHVGRSETQKLFSSIIDRVRAEQVASMLLHQVEVYIKKFLARGVREAEELLHQVARDQMAIGAALETDVDHAPGKTHAATVMNMLSTANAIEQLQAQYEKQARRVFKTARPNLLGLKFPPEQAPDAEMVELTSRTRATFADTRTEKQKEEDARYMV